MDLTLIEGPQQEPVSLAEAKLHLRVDDDEEDQLISALISAAREYCENFTGRSLVPQTFELSGGPFASKYGGIRLPMPPLIEVLSFKYIDSEGQEIAIVEGIGFHVAKNAQPALLYPAPQTGWPDDCAPLPDAVRVRFKAGYADAPKSIKQAMLLLIGHFYEHREAVGAGSGAYELPLAVSSLLRPYWVPRW